MRLSTKGRYGVRLMLELALHYGKGAVLLKTIAEMQQVSEKYLWHLIVPLRAAGLISTKRGVHGGYTLAKPPSQITLKEIVEILEGPMSLVECVKFPSVCERSTFCAARDVWVKLSEKLMETLGSITLEELANSQRKKLSDNLHKM